MMQMQFLLKNLIIFVVLALVKAGGMKATPRELVKIGVTINF